jgi:hypothetical protein
MKTKIEILNEIFEPEINDYSTAKKDLQLAISLNLPLVDDILKAMETYATKQTSDLTTQLAKANSDKERLGKILKEHLAEIESSIKLLKGYEGNEIMNSLSKLNVGYEDKATQIKQTLQDCGITL